MKRNAVAVWSALALAALLLSACGGEGRATFTAQVASDPRGDGDISLLDGVYAVFSASSTQEVLFGLDPSGAEYRGFLQFPLDGSTGGDSVPHGARILAADVEFFVRSVSFSSPVPVLMDAVSYPSTGPVAPADFASLPIAPSAFRTFPVLSSDAGRFVRVDVTALLREAVSQGRSRLQLRLMYDFVPSPANGLVRIEDGPASTAPLLTVTWE